MPFQKKSRFNLKPKKLEGDITTSKKDKRFLNPANNRSRPKIFFCCSLCAQLKIDIKKYGHEIVNVVDENSIYSPEHETNNEKDFGKRKVGEYYVKAELLDEMIEESLRNV